MLIYILLLAIADMMVLVASDSYRGARDFPRAIASVWVDVGLPGAGQSKATATDPATVQSSFGVASTGRPSGTAVPVVSSVTASGIPSGVFYTGFSGWINSVTPTPSPPSNATHVTYSGSLTPTSRVFYDGNGSRDPGLSALKAPPGNNHSTCLHLLSLWVLLVTFT
ncbi:hypothetical protein BDBG_06420 [Blastomyces gilchristii SLH14081]|uniref:Uncharacterized protein n=1 Tax=Blastomyces gilchristii (strain SLH14081) TaxID=559298 RepID=A0A179UTN3_BLAGS|nr:uncharacterized protein BDBG_06420 [Blastomyces gilchristii SLH14081]OAT10599.1 hypothetical protein BDBG_06420 [Blastomyces gilchristii SLH14081]